MQRLTERDSNGDVYVKQHDYVTAADKLADYEDLEEQGLLLRLPCKVGTEFYYVGQKAIKGELKNKWEICATYVSSFEVLGEEIIIYDNVGLDYNMNNIFLAKEEAEAKLREMEAGE